MPGGRRCRQCSAVFVPRREHAKFCSRACRVAWNREQLGGLPVGSSVLGWSLTAMRDAIGALTRRRAWDRTRAFEAINDAVWRVTMLDAALVRYEPSEYDAALGRLDASDRTAVEETLAGLRLVRNRCAEPDDLAGFVGPPAADRTPFFGQITGWQWQPVPAPPAGAQPTTAQAWEQARYRAYRDRLEGTAIGDTFERCTAFLLETAGRAAAMHANA